MTSTVSGIATLNSPLAGRSVEELLLFVADDDRGYRAEAVSMLLAEGLDSIYPVLERGVHDDSNANFRNGAMDTLVAFGKRSIPYLVRLLQDPNEEVRTFACVMLGDIGNREAVGHLIKVLGDGDSNVSHGAAEALGKIGDRAALFPLIELLKGDFWIQYSAISAIGAMKDYRAVPHLLEILDNQLLTGAVIEALGKIGDPRALHPLAKLLPFLDPATAGQAAKAIMEIYRATNDALTFKNSLAEYHQPEHLQQLLGRDGVEKLLFLLNPGTERPVVEAVVMLLGWYGDPGTAGTLLALLDDDSLMGAVEAAMLSLGKRAAPLLTAALDHPNDRVKIVALRTLRYLGALDAPEQLATFLRSPNTDLQTEALEAVKCSPGKTHFDTLRHLLQTAAEPVATRAAEALGCFPFASLEESLAAMAAADEVETRLRGVKLLSRINDEADGRFLGGFMEDPDPRVRRSAMQTAGIRKSTRAIAKLGEALSDPDISVRVAALLALGEYRTPMLVEEMLALLGSGDESIDHAVFKTLGMMAAKEAENALVNYLENGCSSRRLEYTLLETLGRITAVSASKTIRSRYLSSPDPDIRRLAVETLGQLGDRSSLEAVESALADSHWNVRVAALHVLGKLGGEREMPLLIEASNDQDLMVRKHAILALGEIRSVAAIPALVQQLADMDMSRHSFIALLQIGRQALPWLHRHMLKKYTVEIRVRLIDLIGKIGDRRSVEPLMELLEDPSHAVRLAAIDSLAFCFDGLLLKRLTTMKKHDVDEEVRERASLALKTLSMEKFN